MTSKLPQSGKHSSKRDPEGPRFLLRPFWDD